MRHHKYQEKLFSGRQSITFPICIGTCPSYNRPKENEEKSGFKRLTINRLLFIYGLNSYEKDKNQLNFLVNTVQIFSLDIGIDNCGILEMKSGRYEGSEGIKLSDQWKVKEMDVENEYEYLGILKLNRIKDQKMKENIQKKYTRQKIQVQKILRSKVNGVNSFMAINSW